MANQGPPPVIPLDQDNMEDPLVYLFRTCGVNILQTRQCLLNHGYNSVGAFRRLSEKSLNEFAKALNKGRFAYMPKLGNTQVRNLLGLQRWVSDRYLKGLELDPFLFTEEELERMIVEMEGEVQIEKEKKTIPMPPKFEGDKWIDWQENFENYLRQRLGYSGAPLAYVIRRDNPAAPPATDAMIRMYNASLQGTNFNKDNQEVYYALKELTLGTPAWQFIKDLNELEDGRRMMHQLRQHYEGPHLRVIRIAEAKGMVDKAYYENETKLTYEKFSVRLTNGYNTLKQYGAAPSAEMQVLHLCESIKCGNQAIQTAVHLAQANPDTRYNLQAAIAYIGESVYRVFPKGTS
jgi:hypothetical protein